MNTLPGEDSFALIFDELREIQRQFGYLPADQLKALAKKIDVPLYRLHGVASFYPHFHLTPPPKADVRICQDMSCHLRGARGLRTGLEESFRQAGYMDAKIGGVSCLGRCNEAPAVAINEHIYSGLSQNQITAMVGDVLAGDAPPKISQVHRRVPCASDPYGDGEHYQTVQRLIASRDWAGAFETLKASGLRGLGGAGFLTESKWQLVRQAVGPEKFIVCNADESEPGTFKDRFILTHLPHLVIEGMILAGLLTGAQKGILYIRHEYGDQERILREEIRRCERKGLLGAQVLGSEFTFDLEIFVSPGGYICGEETALLEAIEGKRAEPRNKPPFPVQQGLWNKPTVCECSHHSFPRRGLVQIAGPERLGRAEIYWRERRRGASRRVRSADGHAGIGADFQIRRRHRGRKKTERVRALRPIFRIFAGVHGGCAAGFQIARGCRVDARLRRAGGVRRGPLHAGYGAEFDPVLPQRILRQVRTLPRGFAEISGDVDGLDRRKRFGRRHRVN